MQVHAGEGCLAHGSRVDEEGNTSECKATATHALLTEVVTMIGRYNRLPPEEQRIVNVTLVAAAAALWFAVAWEEVMVLTAFPLLAIVATALIRTSRRRARREQEEPLY
jgi:hypothetical protein